jgi:hypothetical protein
MNTNNNFPEKGKIYFHEFTDDEYNCLLNYFKITNRYNNIYFKVNSKISGLGWNKYGRNTYGIADLNNSNKKYYSSQEILEILNYKTTMEKETQIPQVGEWWVITERPGTWSSGTGGSDGKDEVKYPYYFQIKKRELGKYEHYSLCCTNNWGWSLTPKTEHCFRKAELSELTHEKLNKNQLIEVAKSFYKVGDEMYPAHDDRNTDKKRGHEYDIQSLDNLDFKYKRYADNNEVILLGKDKINNATFCIYHSLDKVWSKVINNSTTMSTEKPWCIKRNKNNFEKINKWANSQKLTDSNYSRDNGWIYSLPVSNGKQHILADTDGYNIRQHKDFREITFDEFLKITSYGINTSQSTNSANDFQEMLSKAIILDSTENSFLLEYTPKQKSTLPTINLQIQNFNFNL